MDKDVAELSALDWVDEPELTTEDADEDAYPLSASQIKTNKTCPKQYEFSYLTDKQPTKAEKGYLALGSAVHLAIEEILEGGKPPEYRNQLTHDLKKEYRNTDEAQHLRQEIDEDMYEDGLEYLEIAARYLNAKSDEDIVGVEKEVEYGLARPDINSRVRGIMDVATENEVWDWKTGRVRDGIEVDEQIQGAVYMRGYEREFGHPPDKIRFIYLKEEKERAIEPSDETWQTMLRHARTLIRNKKEDNFPAKPSSFCYFCGYEGYCSEAPAGVGNIDWEKF